MKRRKAKKATGHIITPEGREIAATRGMWNKAAPDWKALACFLECDDCETPVGQEVDHPAH